MMKLKQIFENFLSLFYPRSCVTCGNALLQNERHICLDCLMHLPETNFHLMENTPLDYIFMGRVPVQKVSSMLFYKKGDSVQRILHSLKYKGNKEIGNFLGEIYADGEPVPIHMKSTNDSAFEIVYRLDVPVRSDIYDYIVKD